MWALNLMDVILKSGCKDNFLAPKQNSINFVKTNFVLAGNKLKA